MLRFSSPYSLKALRDRPLWNCTTPNSLFAVPLKGSRDWVVMERMVDEREMGQRDDWTRRRWALDEARWARDREGGRRREMRELGAARWALDEARWAKEGDAER